MEPSESRDGPQPSRVTGVRRSRAVGSGQDAAKGPIGRRAEGIHSFFTRELWSRELASLPTFRRWWYSFARVVQLTGVNFVKDRCTWRASALTYITVLSLVPLLALAFSVAKGMGAYDTLLDETITPFLDSTFGPAEPELEDVEEALVGPEPPADVQAEPDPESESAETSTEDPERPAAATESSQIRSVIDTVLGFVQDTNVASLGVFGFLFVLFTVIKLLGSVEASLNDIWGVQKARSFPRKLADYFSTVILVPLLLVVGTGVAGMARSDEVDRILGLGADSPLVALFSSLAVVWAAFAVAYIVMPNTRVQLGSALVGGIVGGTMWQLFQWAHLKLQIGVANYNAIYSTFAALPIFLFWLQSSWMTVLLGAEAAAARQNQARHGQLVRSRDYDLALKEVVALRLAARVTRAFLAGERAPKASELAEAVGCPERTLLEVAAGLTSAQIVAPLGDDDEEPAFVLASDPDRIRLQDVIDSLKGDSLIDATREEFLAIDDSDDEVDRAFERFRSARDAMPSNLTLRELAEERPTLTHEPPKRERA
ncbi:MAG: YihY/virulence factor BrkB family protein [Planctomycetota bacterium]